MKLEDFSDAALVVLGHGTTQNAESAAPVFQHAAELRRRRCFAVVREGFWKQEPRVGGVLSNLTERRVFLAPLFISDGLHVRQDIPVLLGEPARSVQQRVQNGQPTWRNPTERHGKLVWYAPSVGTDPLVADVILERVREGATGSMKDEG